MREPVAGKSMPVGANRQACLWAVLSFPTILLIQTSHTSFAFPKTVFKGQSCGDLKPGSSNLLRENELAAIGTK